MKPYLIGITGGSASGKTTFLSELMATFEDDICLISQDNYYISRDLQEKDESGVINFDRPESIDRKSFHNDVLRIKQGLVVEKEEYTFNNPLVVPKMLTFQPAPIVVIEGLFVLYFEEIKELLDLKLFVETESHVALKRRIIRDKEERGYDLDDVLYRFEKHVMPAYERYLRPTRHEADLIIPNNLHYKNALTVLRGFIETKLSQQRI
ncbi:uridine kinase family protein [Fulvivirga sedimenti]|nr:uridine kinase [Fulvivirga sedimenti]